MSIHPENLRPGDIVMIRRSKSVILNKTIYYDSNLYGHKEHTQTIETYGQYLYQDGLIYRITAIQLPYIAAIAYGVPSMLGPTTQNACLSIEKYEFMPVSEEFAISMGCGELFKKGNPKQSAKIAENKVLTTE